MIEKTSLPVQKMTEKESKVQISSKSALHQWLKIFAKGIRPFNLLLLLLLVWINIILLCEGPFPQPDYYCLNIVNIYSPKHKHDIDKIINIFHSFTDMAQGSAIQEIQSSPNLYYFQFPFYFEIYINTTFIPIFLFWIAKQVL